MSSLEPIVYDNRVENNQDVIVFLPPSLHRPNAPKFQIFVVSEARRMQLSSRNSLLDMRPFVASGQTKFSKRRQNISSSSVPVESSEFHKKRYLQSENEPNLPTPQYVVPLPKSRQHYNNHQRNVDFSLSAHADNRQGTAITNSNVQRNNGPVLNSFGNRLHTEHVQPNNPAMSRHAFDSIDTGSQSKDLPLHCVNRNAVGCNDQNSFQSCAFLNSSARVFPTFIQNSCGDAGSQSRDLPLHCTNRNAVNYNHQNSFQSGTFVNNSAGLFPTFMQNSGGFPVYQNHTNSFVNAATSAMIIDEQEQLATLNETEMMQLMIAKKRQNAAVTYWPNDGEFLNDDDVEEFQIETTTENFQNNFPKNNMGRSPLLRSFTKRQNNLGLNTPLRNKMAQNRMQITKACDDGRGNLVRGVQNRWRKSRANRRFY